MRRVPNLPRRLLPFPAAREMHTRDWCEARRSWSRMWAILGVAA